MSACRELFHNQLSFVRPTFEPARDLDNLRQGHVEIEAQHVSRTIVADFVVVEFDRLASIAASNEIAVLIDDNVELNLCAFHGYHSVIGHERPSRCRLVSPGAFRSSG